MGLDYSAEEKLANLIIKKHNISHPFDIENLISNYATLIYKIIPIEGVDGVSINIKTPGKKPKIIINQNLPSTRKLFTLAHELGHLIIPWHTGTIVDDIFNTSYKDFLYHKIEMEANRFAAQLLMPANYIFDFLERNKVISELHKDLVENLGVSGQSSAIRIIQLLPPEIIYIAVQNNIIIDCGKSQKTNISLPEVEDIFDKDFLKYYGNLSTYITKGVNYYWYDLKTEVSSLEKTETRDWRQVLNDIVKDIEINEEAETFKKSINGKVSFAHGSVKNRDDYSYSTVFIACLNRMKNFENKDFINHKDFETFLKLRAESFVQKL